MKAALTLILLSKFNDAVHETTNFYSIVHSPPNLTFFFKAIASCSVSSAPISATSTTTTVLAKPAPSVFQQAVIGDESDITGNDTFMPKANTEAPVLPPVAKPSPASTVSQQAVIADESDITGNDTAISDGSTDTETASGQEINDNRFDDNRIISAAANGVLLRASNRPTSGGRNPGNGHTPGTTMCPGCEKYMQPLKPKCNLNDGGQLMQNLIQCGLRKVQMQSSWGLVASGLLGNSYKGSFTCTPRC
jgi:hypothetical protein